MTRFRKKSAIGSRAEFIEALQKALVVGALALLLALPLLVNKPAPPAAPPLVPAVMRADFGEHGPSADARSVADWVVDSGDNGSMSFVVVDKKDARVYVFNPSGRLRDTSPALLGSARGDDSAPGVGDKPLSRVRPDERTTPAGRFMAKLGMNAKGEDIVWIDYGAAVSMHRVRATVRSERRLQRLASATPDDNRISYGCVNLPVAFYENILKPTVQAGSTVIYVLPETRRPATTFASFYDVDERLKLAERPSLTSTHGLH